MANSQENKSADSAALQQRQGPVLNRDAILESAVQAVAVRAGDADRISLVSAYDAIRGLKSDRQALPEQRQAPADLRSRFESWARHKMLSVERDGKDDYTSIYTQVAWATCREFAQAEAAPAPTIEQELRAKLDCIYFAGVAKMDPAQDYERVIAHISQAAPAPAEPIGYISRDALAELQDSFCNDNPLLIRHTKSNDRRKEVAVYTYNKE